MASKRYHVSWFDYLLGRLTNQELNSTNLLFDKTTFIKSEYLRIIKEVYISIVISHSG